MPPSEAPLDYKREKRDKMEVVEQGLSKSKLLKGASLNCDEDPALRNDKLNIL